MSPRPVGGPARGVLQPRGVDADAPVRAGQAFAQAVRHGRFAPSEALAEAVEHFWTVEWDLRGQPPLRPRTLPHPSVHLVVEGARHEVTGIHTRRFERLLEGRGEVFAVKFRPAMFHGLWGRPVGLLANRVVPVREALGEPGARLCARLQRERTLEKRIALTEEFLRARLPSPEPLALLLRDLVERAAHDRAFLSAEHLTAASGLPLRTLQRHFHRYVGATPKWVLQRYRLHEAAERLQAAPDTDLATLALDLGYSDQPHCVRDFKALAGEPPGSYAKLVATARSPASAPPSAAGARRSSGRGSPPSRPRSSGRSR
jgi:AraC-like DNA-binding protein